MSPPRGYIGKDGPYRINIIMNPKPRPTIDPNAFVPKRPPPRPKQLEEADRELHEFRLKEHLASLDDSIDICENLLLKIESGVIVGDEYWTANGVFLFAQTQMTMASVFERFNFPLESILQLKRAISQFELIEKYYDSNHDINISTCNSKIEKIMKTKNLSEEKVRSYIKEADEFDANS